jgi:hypothetical protein
VVQFWVVPRVEARKRRADRWEHDLRELGELMTTVLAERALAANVEQSAFRYVRQLEGAPDADKDKVAQLKSEYSLKARQATAAFNDLAHALVPWLVDRVASVGRASDEIQFKNAARHHRIPAMAVDDWSGDYVPPDQILDEAWDQERDARKALVEQVTALLDLPHPPRVSLPRRGWRRGAVLAHRAITWAETSVRRSATGQIP